ncbi:RecB family exonuclease [Helicobacter baculiformis]|uniref:RecB family exonuclease n=1 Tax=Helicobacter baculiformis TaxID=427351 RepID=A0ABV7ZK57_9HELI|nr:PD-(D/E)XK nuclease family protein [Helicobacter baculiformis]
MLDSVNPSTLYVFSSHRACNAFYAKQHEGFLPTAWSVQEFYTQVSFVKGLVKIPKSARQVLLMEAIKEVAKEGAPLEGLVLFEQSFLGYLDGSTFVARFFNELAKFKRHIHEITTHDIYGDYVHHLEVLERVHACYHAKLQAWGYYDPILGAPSTLLTSVLAKFARIEFYLEGFLSTDEQEILFAIAQNVPLILHVACDRYNKQFLGFLGLDLQEEHTYALNLQALKRGENPFVQAQPQPPLCPKKVEVYAFDQRLDQVGLALQRVQEWLEEGLEPSMLAIITPDPQMIPTLKLLDTEHNLNFARGQEAQVVFAPYFSALEELKMRWHPITTHALNALEEQCNAILAQLYAKIPPKLEHFHQDFFQTYARILPALQSYNPIDLLELYTRALQDLRIDDTTGGKVKVLDVLECRGLSFERVVILDFNDHIVPSLKDGDLFLNTQTRRTLGLPTLQDKENLQKHYYYQLIKSSARVDISYSTANNAIPSKMLAQLDLNTRLINSHSASLFKLFPNSRSLHDLEDTCIGYLPREFSLSASKLKDFTECRRRFYLKYLQKLIPMPQEGANQGTLLHRALQSYYSSKTYHNTQTPISAKTLLESLQGLQEWESLNALERFNLEVSVQKLTAFFTHERIILAHAKVVGYEVPFETSFKGFELKGIIDRFDLCEDGAYRLIDYKFKSKVEQQDQDYQLAIYTLGACALGYPQDRLRAYFYDLKKGELLERETLSSDLESLAHLLITFQEEEIDFFKTEDRKHCKYCPYTDVCGV